MDMICELVLVEGQSVQQNRPATTEEQAEIDARRAAAPAASKAAMWEQIKAARERCKNGGVLVSGNWFHTDVDSRIQLMALVMMGMSIPAGLQWKTMARNPDGSAIFVTMNRDLANQIFLAIVNLDQTAFAKAEEHRIAMEASATPSTYNFSTGWPTIYSGS